MSEEKKLPLLKVNGIHVYYGAIHAIKGISLEVNEGEIVTLIGANGAGKSTTLNTIAGLLKPRQGSIAFAGMPVDGTSASKMVYKGLSLCPEGRRIFQQMTVKENLEMGAFSRPNEEIAASIDRVYSFFPRLKEREKQVAEKMHRLENIKIKDRFDYPNLTAISTEARQKLERIQPETLAQASRIPGVSPSDINAMLVLMGR